MTTRPGQAAIERSLWTRGKNVAHAITIAPQRGEPIHVTDHDRIFEVDGFKFRPAPFGRIGADLREAAFRAGGQDLRGLIDGDILTIPDIDAFQYRGAEVFQRLVDWKIPQFVYARHRRFIRSVVRSGIQFVAQLEARTQALERPHGGRFGGVFDVSCPYRLGDLGTCKADISSDVRTVTAQAVVGDRRTIQFDPAGWPGAFADNYYRDGSVDWQTGDNAGAVSPIVESIDANKQIELLIPTARPIAVGDIAIVSPGCDGLRTTCRDKFNNILNFGGDPFAPAAQALLPTRDKPVE